MSEKKVDNTKAANQGPVVMMEKSKDIKKAYADFFKYISNFKWLVGISIILSFFGAILNLIGPDKLSEITDLITKGLASSIDVETITNISILLAILYGLGYVFNYIQGFIMATVSQRVTQNMRRDISAKINRLPLKYFDTNSTGDVLSRVTNDVDTVGQMMNQSFSTLVSSLALLFGSAIMMFANNAILAISGILSTFIGFFFVGIIIAKSQTYFSKQQAVLGQINGHIEEIYGGHTIVKVYNGEKAARKEFHDLNNELYNCASKAQFLSGLMMPIMIFVGNLSYVVICIVGAVLAVQGSITFGTIVAFMLYIRLFSQPLQNISQAAASIQSMAAACERVFNFLDEEEMETEQGKLQNLTTANGNIIFENIHFGYNADKVVIKDFSTHVKPCQKIAIVGPTGAGKTTIVNLLMRFYEINQGSIYIDGINTKDLTRENVHNLFGMVLQDTWLFEGTIRENLVYNKSNVSDEKLDEVCKATGLWETINQLPKGYDTILDEYTSLSAGQKQLMTIARAMIQNAPLLILDEATSSVDTRTELKVQQAMDKLMEGRTSFVIAHRLSTIKNADKILVMKEGNIIESGNHEELLLKGGFYADLYNSQFEQVS